MIEVGILTPHAAAGADDEFCVMAGRAVRTHVRRIRLLPDGSAPTSPEELRAHADPSVVDATAAELHPRSLQAIAYASTSTAYLLGHRDERELVARLADRWDVPVCSTPASAVDALRRLGAERLAVVHPPWFGEEHNALGAAYFRDQGFSVSSAHLADVTDDPALVEPDEVVEWVAENVPGDVDAVFLGGNGVRAARAVGPLEQRLDRPVVESNQVLLWSVNESLGDPLDVRGFGRLLAPRRDDPS
jgi:maleate isomerase